MHNANQVPVLYTVPLEYDTIRYDTRSYFNVRSKADISHLIYRMEPKTKKWRKKLESYIKTDMLRSIGKQPVESVESVLEKKRKATVGRICRKERF